MQFISKFSVCAVFTRLALKSVQVSNAGPTTANPVSFDNTKTQYPVAMLKTSYANSWTSPCSAKYGKTMRNHDHCKYFDAIEQLSGLTDCLAPDPKSVDHPHAKCLTSQNL